VLPFVELFLLLASAVFGILCFRFRVSYRLSIVVAIVTLVIAGLALAARREDIENMGGLLAYYLIVVGVLLALMEYRTESQQSLRGKFSD